MADSAVSFLLENVTQLLIREVGLIQGVGDQIRSLKVELAQIHQFLRDSKGKRELVKEVVSEIRSIAQEAEDVLDTFVVDMAKQKRRNTLDKFFHKISDTFRLRDVATKIEGIKNRIADIYSNRDKYGIINNESGDEEITRRDSLNTRRRQVEEEEVVSFVKDTETVKAMLSNKIRRLDVVSIVGMGGLGKTTLAKKIYNDNVVKNQFKCRAWVYVSQEFRARDVLLQILQTVAESTEGIYEMTDQDLVAALKKYLQDKRYLIVLDDVWRPEVWTGIKGAFPDTNNCSRILVTSRIKEVASHASTTPPYLLPLLGKDDSWQLFSKKAFRGEACPPTLERNGRKIAEKCNGLPLALVVVGGLLATREQSTRVWSQMVDNVSWYLEKNPESFYDVLALSYEELLPHLKPCFLYLGIFPEDYEMSARQLIRLWVSEGLIEQDPRRKPEDIADEYLQDLADRSLIMVVKWRSDGGIKTCIIHDLLRDMCIAEAAQDNFFLVHNGNGFIKSFSDRPRRISLQCTTSRYASSSIHPGSSLVRTLLYFGDKEAKNKLLISKDFRLLRVLDLGQTLSKELPPKFEKLVLLRYLCIKGAVFLDGIPLFISNLPNLQTLDLRDSDVNILNNNFWNMQQLRHLFLGGRCDYEWRFNSLKFVKTMRNLQTLSGITGIFAFDVRKTNAFPNLRKLGVQSSWYNSHLSSTRVSTSESSAYCNVQTLKLTAGSHFLTHNNVIPPLLTKLTLISTRTTPSEFIKIRLPNLETLKLMKDSIAYGEETSYYVNPYFGKLQVLHMVELGIRQWWLGGESFSNLRYLLISKCDLAPIPEELSKITTLRHVKASWCPPQFNESLRTLGDAVHLDIQSYR
jgi:disease resistance protein RPM1